MGKSKELPDLKNLVTLHYYKYKIVYKSYKK